MNHSLFCACVRGNCLFVRIKQEHACNAIDISNTHGSNEEHNIVTWIPGLNKGAITLPSCLKSNDFVGFKFSVSSLGITNRGNGGNVQTRVSNNVE